MKYRNRTDIVYHILQSADHHDGYGVTKTKIMYGSFLSYKQLKEYLTVLTEKGLLQYDSTSQKFTVTKKGHRFLEIYDQAAAVMKQQQQV